MHKIIRIKASFISAFTQGPCLVQICQFPDITLCTCREERALFPVAICLISMWRVPA